MTQALQQAINRTLLDAIPKMKEGAATVQSIHEKFNALNLMFEPASPEPLPAWQYRQTVLQNSLAGPLADLAQIIDAYWECTDWFRNPNYIHDKSLGRFRNGYGYNQYVGDSGMVKSSEIAIGIMLISPDCVYPAHDHLAEEIYIPISGRAEWWTAENDWQIREPGTPIFHRSWLPHATRTLKEPLLALYGWLGDSAKHATISA
ncbi:MAG: hypothetical protein ACI9EW_002127 [Cellvibrionaceae bacterium]|jgi:hypothetical protein